VVAGGRHAEALADGALLGARVLPPVALEVEELAGAPIKLARRLGGVDAHNARLATTTDGSSTFAI
jgi:hypothetical protein